MSKESFSSNGNQEHVKGHNVTAVMLLGVGGTGKSTIARELNVLLRKVGYHTQLIHFDELRKQLAPEGCDPFSDDQRIKWYIYEKAIELFQQRLNAGCFLIIDAGLSVEAIRRRIRERVSGIRIIHVHCPLWLAILRDTKRSVCAVPHERGHFLHLRALRDLLNPFKSRDKRFKQPGITYRFEYPESADLHVSTLWENPRSVAEQIAVEMGLVTSSTKSSTGSHPRRHQYFRPQVR